MSDFVFEYGIIPIRSIQVRIASESALVDGATSALDGILELRIPRANIGTTRSFHNEEKYRAVN